MSLQALGIDHKHVDETLVATIHLNLKGRAELPAVLAEVAGCVPGDAIAGPARDASRDEAENEGRQSSRREIETRESERRASQRREHDERERSNPLKRKTYLLTPELIDQVADLAETERVGINELVRYLLRSSLEMVEAGELPIPTRPATRKIVRGE